MNKSLLSAILIFTAAIIGGVLCYMSNLNPPTSHLEFTDRQGNVHQLKLEVAADAASRARGLMNRTVLPADSGMLFIFPEEDIRQFWMKDTLISLDIIFLDDGGKVVKIHKATKPNQTSEKYSSGSPAMYALETNAGWAARVGLAENDQINLFKNF